MTIRSTGSVERNETRTGGKQPDQEIVGVTPWTEPTDVGAPPLYDKVDRRLMDTFPASDAVAQY